MFVVCTSLTSATDNRVNSQVVVTPVPRLHEPIYNIRMPFISPTMILGTSRHVVQRPDGSSTLTLGTVHLPFSNCYVLLPCDLEHTTRTKDPNTHGHHSFMFSWRPVQICKKLVQEDDTRVSNDTPLGLVFKARLLHNRRSGALNGGVGTIWSKAIRSHVV